MNVNVELEREIASIRHGNHLCLIYESPAEQLAAIIPYLRRGLARGERCIYVVDERTAGEIDGALTAAGIDVDAEKRRGALILQSARDIYLPQGEFDPQATITFLRRTTQQALEEGFAGLLMTGEMSWALGPEPGNHRLIEYENLLNQFFPDSRAHTVCQYNRKRFPASVIHDVLRTHPIAILGGLVCSNIFYEPTEMVEGRRSIEEETEWRIAQLRQARRTQRSLEATEAANRFLSDATALLVSTFDHESTLNEVARLAVPRIADCCLIEIFGDDMPEWRFATVAHVDPERAEAARAGLVDNQDRTRVLVELGLETLTTLPMVTRHRTLGTFTVGNTPGRPLSELNRGVIEHLARRTALAVENARLYREAREAIRARDDFLSVASHELRTPLTPLQLQLDQVAATLERDRREGDAKLAARITMSRRQAERLARLVEELLDVSRITRGSFDLHLENMDLVEVVNTVVDRLSPAAQSGAAHIEVHSDGPAVGRWDRRRIDQVVTSLVANAIKYGDRKPIDIDVALGDATARLTVRDRGIGIAPEDVARIFERFERAVSMRHFGGLGLGLYVARQMVEAHGGSIVVRSAPGKGSTFTVVLPLRAATQGKRHRPADQGAHR